MDRPVKRRCGLASYGFEPAWAEAGMLTTGARWRALNSIRAQGISEGGWESSGRRNAAPERSRCGCGANWDRLQKYLGGLQKRLAPPARICGMLVDPRRQRAIQRTAFWNVRKLDIPPLCRCCGHHYADSSISRRAADFLQRRTTVALRFSSCSVASPDRGDQVRAARRLHGINGASEERRGLRPRGRPRAAGFCGAPSMPS